MNTHFLRRLGAIAALLSLVSLAGAAPAIIANKGLEKEKIDASTLKAVFLGKKVAWDTGGRAILAVLKGGPVADEFLKGAVDMSSSSFNNYWRRLAMTGGGSAPHVFEKDEDVRKYVSDTPGAIGFVDSASVDASVAVITLAP